MKRREFVKKGLFYSVAASVYAATIGRIMPVLGQKSDQPKGNYDLVAVRGGQPADMYKKAMEEMGGIAKFVKRGQTVVIKPNIGWDVTPERAANTNPDLVGAIVKDCVGAGARRVFVFDNTCDQWQRCYTNSGIEKAVIDNGGQMVPGNLERYYQEVKIPGAKKLKSTKVHEQIINADVFINVPVLKHHASTGLTIAMKNLMGAVWNRRWWHINNLHQCIADFCLYCKPTLNIVDAHLVMKKNGPRGTSTSDLTLMQSLLVSTDIVAIDAASTLLFGDQPDNVGYISIADEMGIGTADLSKLNIQRVYL
ncbi:MAG: DUF362 domain-containing protein [Bacteroidetes bacterium]|nr:DUF362 domain-containing protein [Bacteroidota bacterium]